MKRHNCTNIEDFYAAIGYGGVILSRIMQRIKERYQKFFAEPENTEAKASTTSRHSSSGVIVEGENNILVKFAQCCNPLPGDDIIGFITRGHGVSVHKKDCENYVNAMKNNTEPERWVNVIWAASAKSSSSPIFKVTLDIVSKENIQIIADVSKVMADMHIPMTDISLRMLKNGNANVLVTISTAGVAQLNNIIAKLKKLPDVLSVDRTGK